MVFPFMPDLKAFEILAFLCQFTTVFPKRNSLNEIAFPDLCLLNLKQAPTLTKILAAMSVFNGLQTSIPPPAIYILGFL